MRGGVYYPSLIILAWVANKTGLEPWTTEPGDAGWLPQYLRREREFSAKTRHNLDAFMSHRSDPVIWGMGLEYFNLLANEVLPVDSSTILVDSNSAKQALTVSGCPVCAPAQVLIGKPLICTASLSWRPIVEQARALGFDINELCCI